MLEFIVNRIQSHEVVVHALGKLELFFKLFDRDEVLLSSQCKLYVKKTRMMMSSSKTLHMHVNNAYRHEFESEKIDGVFTGICNGASNLKPQLVCSSISYALTKFRSVEVLYCLIERDYYERCHIFHGSRNSKDYLELFVKECFSSGSRALCSAHDILEITLLHFVTGSNIKYFNIELLATLFRLDCITTEDFGQSLERALSQWVSIYFVLRCF
jgi:hypothetical protein